MEKSKSDAVRAPRNTTVCTVAAKVLAALGLIVHIGFLVYGVALPRLAEAKLVPTTWENWERGGVLITPIVCVFIGAYVQTLWISRPVVIAGQILASKRKVYPNRNPRNVRQNLNGMPARAAAAETNQYEAAVRFAPAVVFALLTHVPPVHVVFPCIVWVIARTLYHIMYLMDVHLARSLIWHVALTCTVHLFAMAITGDPHWCAGLILQCTGLSV